jgi:hypothetical protein
MNDHRFALGLQLFGMLGLALPIETKTHGLFQFSLPPSGQPRKQVTAEVRFLIQLVEL